MDEEKAQEMIEQMAGIVGRHNRIAFYPLQEEVGRVEDRKQVQLEVSRGLWTAVDGALALEMSQGWTNQAELMGFWRNVLSEEIGRWLIDSLSKRDHSVLVHPLMHIAVEFEGNMTHWEKIGLLTILFRPERVHGILNTLDAQVIVKSGLLPEAPQTPQKPGVDGPVSPHRNNRKRSNENRGR
jgi:hypothetical protein